jgi:hypothetical protein
VGYDPRVDLLTDLKNVAVCQEWDKHIEDIKARFQYVAGWNQNKSSRETVMVMTVTTVHRGINF